MAKRKQVRLPQFSIAFSTIREAMDDFASVAPPGSPEEWATRASFLAGALAAATLAGNSVIAREVKVLLPGLEDGIVNAMMLELAPDTAH